MQGHPQIRIVAFVPAPPTRREKIRQLSWALFRIVSEARPGVFVVNDAGWGKRLFSTSTGAEAYEKRDRVESELEALDFDEWCARYRVTSDFITADHRPASVRGLRRFRPLL